MPEQHVLGGGGGDSLEVCMSPGLVQTDPKLQKEVGACTSFMNADLPKPGPWDSRCLLEGRCSGLGLPKPGPMQTSIMCEVVEGRRFSLCGFTVSTIKI